MKNFLRKVHSMAHRNPKRIVFPDSIDPRILKAVEEIQQKKIAHPILIGNPKTLKQLAKKHNCKIDFSNTTIEDPENSQLKDQYIESLFLLRKDKGLTKKEAKELLKTPEYFSTMMVYHENADGMVAGAIHPTAVSIKPALQIIKTKEKFHKVSGIFFMVLEKRILVFADAAITINPNSHDLADIASDTAETAKKFGIDPRIAFLSFSTKGSAQDPSIDKINEALAIAKDRHPEFIIDGELQVDSALVPEVAKRKCPNSPIKGQANVLIFPDLNSANIAYKLVERLAKAKAIGPILQGLKKPINKVSRGASISDIINVTAFTVCLCD